MVALPRAQLRNLNSSFRPMVVCCNDLEVIKSMWIAPTQIHDSWDIKGYCQPNYIVVYFGYKGTVYRIEVTVNGICYSIHEDTHYNWRIDILEMYNQEANRFGSFLESPEVPMSPVYYLLLEKIIEIEDFYE